MRIKKYDAGYSRRHFISQLSRGLLTTGVLAPLWEVIADTGDITNAYPDELLSIDGYTKGKLNVGDEITADNVNLVKDLLDPIRYQQISTMGRKLRLTDTTTDIMKLSPWEYLHATLANDGQAVLDATGNIVTRKGEPWIGGNPFPNPKSALEAFANITLSWGRHDVSCYAIKEYDLDERGEQAYHYQSYWVEMAATGRLVLEPKPYLPEHKDKLRYQSVLFTYPNDSKGSSYLNIWDYDQNQFPQLYGYLPAFKRVRRFPTNQRFEPLVPGSSLYLSDAWAAGDPLLTWGNYKIIHRGPALAAVSRSWNPAQSNWEHGTHGGDDGQTFWDTDVELVPEAIVVEAEPIKYPRAPVSKKRVWIDARTQLPLTMVSYDRRGEVFRSFDGAYSLFESGDQRVMDGNHPYWSWTRVHAHNVQTNRMTRLEQVKEVSGGYRSAVNEPGVYDRYLTRSALRRLGV
jgi:Protein of unknown function (DUF1329)